MKNGFTNTVPELGEAKTIDKFAKMGKVLKASKVSSKTKGGKFTNVNKTKVIDFDCPVFYTLGIYC